MRAYFSRRYQFSASHRLHNDAYSDEENQRTYGKCNNPFGHGHNYILEVTTGGQVDPQTGMVCDLLALDELTRTKVLVPYDMANLNRDPAFHDLVPSTENLCTVIYNNLLPSFQSGPLTGVELVRIRIEETGNNSFEYPAPRQSVAPAARA